MKALKMGFVFLCLLFLVNAGMFADLNKYYGIWRNVDPQGGITRVEIEKSGKKIMIHVWGNCQPKDCDWGKVIAYPYSPSVGQSMTANTEAITAIYDTDFSQSILVIRLNGRHLEVTVFTRFTDGSGRNNYTKVHSFNKSRK
jgi:hypothetical protein